MGQSLFFRVRLEATDLEAMASRCRCRQRGFRSSLDSPIDDGGEGA